VLLEVDTVKVENCVWSAGSVKLVGFRTGAGPTGKTGETVVDRSTMPAKLFTLVTATVDMFENPCTTLREDGLDVILNP